MYYLGTFVARVTRPTRPTSTTSTSSTSPSSTTAIGSRCARCSDRRLHDGRLPRRTPTGAMDDVEGDLGSAAVRSRRSTRSTRVVSRRPTRKFDASTFTARSRSKSAELVQCGREHRPVPRPGHQPRLRVERHLATPSPTSMADPSVRSTAILADIEKPRSRTYL